jgi:hypothetical protein
MFWRSCRINTIRLYTKRERERELVKRKRREKEDDMSSDELIVL